MFKELKLHQHIIDSVLVKENGKRKEAMKLANKVAIDIYLKQDVSYLWMNH